MLRTMRFLWRNFSSVFLLLVGYMAIMMVYAALGGGQEDHDLLWTYYKMSPMVASLLFFFFEMAAGSGWLFFGVYFAVFLGRELIPWGALISLWPCCVLAAAVLLALSVVSLFRLSFSP